MVSVYTKVGISLFVFGTIITFMVVAFGVSFPFMIAKYGQSISMETIPTDGSYVDIQIPGSFSHPFSIQLTIKSTISTEADESIYGYIKVLYSNPDKGIFGELPAEGDSSFNLNYEGTGNKKQLTQHMSLSPKYASSSFNLYLRINCDPNIDYTGSLYLESP